MSGDDEYQIETTLCMIQTVHVFQIPPRSSSGGHRANDWTREVWDGKLKIVQKGSTATVYLLDKHNNNEFAQAPGTSRQATASACEHLATGGES